MTQIIDWIDLILEKFTMYRLVLYVLIILIAFSSILSALNLLPFTPLELVISTTVILATGIIANKFLAQLFDVPVNNESVYITSLILALVITPSTNPETLILMAVTSVLSMTSKYFLAIKNKHIFNPVAISLVITELVLGFYPSWWVGNRYLLPLVLIGGILILRKIGRFKMVLTFLLTYLIIITISAWSRSPSVAGVLQTWQLTLVESQLLFFAFTMLTEPLTSPAVTRMQMVFATVVALLFATPQLLRSEIALTPEMALVFGNIFSYLVNPKFSSILKLKEKNQLGENTYSFVFDKPANFTFTPGQYMEWTLPHAKEDSRGNRRFFSIASSPTENDVMLLAKLPPKSSSFKKSLYNLEPDEKIKASNISGQFTLPMERLGTCVFIAGGVGIAPFRSMFKFINDKKITVPMTLFFANKTEAEIVLKNFLDKLEKENGLKTVYILTDKEHTPQDWTGEVGHINAAMIEKYIADYKDKLYFVSGPQTMVKEIEKMLLNMGIKNSQIIRDYFPGY